MAESEDQKTAVISEDPIRLFFICSAVGADIACGVLTLFPPFPEFTGAPEPGSQGKRCLQYRSSGINNQSLTVSKSCGKGRIMPCGDCGSAVVFVRNGKNTGYPEDTECEHHYENEQ